jgi:hypothetical protein
MNNLLALSSTIQSERQLGISVVQSDLRKNLYAIIEAFNHLQSIITLRNKTFMVRTKVIVKKDELLAKIEGILDLPYSGGINRLRKIMHEVVEASVLHHPLPPQIVASIILFDQREDENFLEKCNTLIERNFGEFCEPVKYTIELLHLNKEIEELEKQESHQLLELRGKKKFFLQLLTDQEEIKREFLRIYREHQ